jgi:hypothetical protein
MEKRVTKAQGELANIEAGTEEHVAKEAEITAFQTEVANMKDAKAQKDQEFAELDFNDSTI